MSTPQWSPGTLYAPGALVVPRSLTGQQPVPPQDPSFESGSPLADWDVIPVGGAGAGAVSSAFKFDGAKSFLWAGGSGSEQEGGIGCKLINQYRAPVLPGQSITAQCYAMSVPFHREHGVFGSVRLFWYDGADNIVAETAVAAYGDGGPGHGFGTTGQWVLSTVTGVAPANAEFCSIGAYLLSNQGDTNGSYVDAFSWNYVPQTLPAGLVFRAVQPDSGYSGANEPVWPTVDGEHVYDNEVIWEAVEASRVVWQATPITKSGSTEPAFPDAPGASVVDNAGVSGIVWVAMDSRVKDPKCPNSKVVAIAASKVFAADKDIIAYSATVNPLDWSTKNDAGYIPFGLQTYGATPVQAMGLYRSNLVGFNEQGYQMWQVDEDPANIALLDAQPVGCRYHRSGRPVMNDFVFLTDLGFRNISIAGASTNLQAGSFGKAIDPLVLAQIRAGTFENALFWPAAGQYWGIFGSQAFVLTVNGGASDMSWSRYIFPEDVTDWTLHEGKLLLRAGTTKVWEMTDEVEGVDDYVCEIDSAPVLAGSRTVLVNSLNWTEVEGAVGYRLYVNDVLLIDTLGITFEHTGLNELTDYNYVVAAYDLNNENGPLSNHVDLPVGGPSAPILDGEIPSDITTAELSWSESTSGGGPIIGYRLYNADTDDLIATLDDTFSMEDRENVQTGLENDTTYSYYMTSITAQSESEHSNTITLDTGHPHIIIDVFTVNGTWTKRPHLISCTVECVGGGGGGASNSATGGGAGFAGGGSGAGYCKFDILEAFLGATEAVTVSLACAGGASQTFSYPFTGAGGIPGEDGGTTTFGSWGGATGGNGGAYTGIGANLPPVAGDGFVTGAPGPTSTVTESGGIGGTVAGVPGSTDKAGAGGGRSSGGAGGGVTIIDPVGGPGGSAGTDTNAGGGTDGNGGGTPGGGGGGGGSSWNNGPIIPGFTSPPSGKGGGGARGVCIVTNYLS